MDVRILDCYSIIKANCCSALLMDCNFIMERIFQSAYLCATRGRVIKLFGADRTCYSISSSLSSPKRLATAVRQHDEKR